MTSSTSNYMKAVLQAKSALQFQDVHESSDDWSTFDKGETLPDTDETLNSKVESSAILESSKIVNPVKLVKEILDNQELLSTHKGNEENKLRAKWSYTLGSPEVVNRLIDVSNRLSGEIENKENILETLRNPIAENSIPWTKERKSDLVDTFTYLERLSKTKVANNSNADWIENQNWEQFTGKELPAVETKILKLEADIAQEVKECKVIKGLTEY